jgi:hypothetical protein
MKTYKQVDNYFKGYGDDFNVELNGLNHHKKMDWLWLLRFLSIALGCDMPILEAVWLFCGHERDLFKEIIGLVSMQLTTRGFKFLETNVGFVVMEKKMYSRNGYAATPMFGAKITFSFDNYSVHVKPEGDPEETIFHFKWAGHYYSFCVERPPGKFYVRQFKKNLTRQELSERGQYFPTINKNTWLNEIVDIATIDRDYIDFNYVATREVWENGRYILY